MTSRSRDPLSRCMAGDGNRLPDLVAAISELRHSPTCAAPGAIVVLDVGRFEMDGGYDSGCLRA
jgi:hypothetical protein